MLKFIGFLVKSPISWLKSAIMKMLKIGLSEMLGIYTKKHLKGCIIKNGARYYAVIGLMNMKILRN